MKSNTPSIFLLLFWFLWPVFGYCADEEMYLIPVTRAEADTQKLSIKKEAHFETVCVEEQCYYVVNQSIANNLMNDGIISDYEPVIDRDLFTTEPADPDFAKQWALNDDVIGWLAGKKIMDTIPALARNSGPVAAIIDTGMVNSHKDINYNNNQYNALWEIGGAPLFYPPGNTINDIEGHGTHVIGIIGATTDNKFGIAGAGYGKVHILPANASNGKGGLSTDKIIDAIGFIIDQKKLGVPIIAVNMSFGSAQFSRYEYDAINRLKNADIIVVAAAGNGYNNGTGYDIGITPIYPGSYDLVNIITVASLEKNLKLADYSNFGGSTSIAAPGSGILGTAVYFIGEGTDNNVNMPGILYQSTNPFDQLIQTHIPPGSRWSRDGEKLKFTPPTSGADVFTVNSIDLTSIAHLRNRTVSLNFSEDLDCAPSAVCSVSMHIKLNNSEIWEQAAGALSTEEKHFLFYSIPGNTKAISIMISVNGKLNPYSQGVTVHKLMIGGADYADSFITRSGTSMAAPFITSVLVAGAAIYPEIKPAQLMNILYGTARRPASLTDKVQGSRLIDLAAFLQMVSDCKDAGSTCKVSNDYPERVGEYNPDTQPTPSSKNNAFFGCSMGGRGGIGENAVWLTIIAVWLVWRRYNWR